MNGIGRIYRLSNPVASASSYAYSWQDNETDANPADTVVAGVTLVQAYNAIGGLATAMPGTVRLVEITVDSR